MFRHLSYLRRGSWLALSLGILVADSSLGHAQFRPVFRGTPSAMAGGFPATGFPGLPNIPLVNNGSMQISRNPNPSFPSATPFAYIAALPLGDRLPYNGILADPQLLPQTIYGQQLAQNILQNIQQQQFGNPLGPTGALLQTGLANPGVNGQPIVQAARGSRVPMGYGYGCPPDPSFMLGMMAANYYYAQMSNNYYAQMNNLNNMNNGNIYQTGMPWNTPMGLGGNSAYYTGNNSIGQSAADYYRPTSLGGFGAMNTPTDLKNFGAGLKKDAKDEKQKKDDKKDETASK